MRELNRMESRYGLSGPAGEDHATTQENPLDKFLCVACLAKPRTTLIQSCKHTTYCKECNLKYDLNHTDLKECPICRKKYTRTLQMMYT